MISGGVIAAGDVRRVEATTADSADEPQMAQMTPISRR
jgi:hypothetical protein